MAKNLTDCVRESEGEHIPKKMADLSIDEITELAIYDAQTAQQRRELVQKKTRKVYLGSEMQVRLVMRNPLKSIPLDVQEIKIDCRYKDSDSGEDAVVQEPARLTVKPLSDAEVLLKIVPMKTGELVFHRITWRLFDVVFCHHLLSPTEQPCGKRLSLTNESLAFKIIEASGDIDVELKLNSLDLGRDSLIYSECCDGKLVITNKTAGMKVCSAFISCSHPLICNFENVRADFGPDKEKKELAAEESFEMPVQLRMVGG